jgi:phage terminase small subunit
MALTNKQRRFVSEYLVDLNATQAATRAGYSGKTANEQGARLLANVSVQAAIQESMKSREQRTEITQDYVLTTIRETIERCRQAHPVLDRKGEQVYVRAGDDDDAPLVPAFTFEANAVLKGAELLGKHLKMFTDKTELSGPNGGPLDAKLTIEYVRPKHPAA